MAWLGYGTGFIAPGVRKEDVGSYEVAHNLIKAHAEAWHTYDEEFRQKQNGLLLFSISFHYLIKKIMQCDAGLLVQCLMTVLSKGYSVQWFSCIDNHRQLVQIMCRTS